MDIMSTTRNAALTSDGPGFVKSQFSTRLPKPTSVEPKAAAPPDNPAPQKPVKEAHGNGPKTHPTLLDLLQKTNETLELTEQLKMALEGATVPKSPAEFLALLTQLGLKSDTVGGQVDMAGLRAAMGELGLPKPVAGLVEHLGLSVTKGPVPAAEFIEGARTPMPAPNPTPGLFTTNLAEPVSSGQDFDTEMLGSLNMTSLDVESQGLELSEAGREPNPVPVTVKPDGTESVEATSLESAVIKSAANLGRPDSDENTVPSPGVTPNVKDVSVGSTGQLLENSGSNNWWNRIIQETTGETGTTESGSNGFSGTEEVKIRPTGIQKISTDILGKPDSDVTGETTKSQGLGTKVVGLPQGDVSGTTVGKLPKELGTSLLGQPKPTSDSAPKDLGRPVADVEGTSVGSDKKVLFQGTGKPTVDADVSGSTVLKQPSVDTLGKPVTDASKLTGPKPVGQPATNSEVKGETTTVESVDKSSVVKTLGVPTTENDSKDSKDVVGTTTNTLVSDGTTDALTPSPAMEPKPIVSPRVDLLKPVADKVLDQVSNRIESMAMNRRSGTVTIKLNPNELGSITLTVKSLGNKIDAEVQASHEDVRNVLLINKQALVQSVEGRGMNLSSFNVGAEQSNGQQQAAYQNDHAETIRNSMLQATNTVTPAPASPRSTYQGPVSAVNYLV